eukprot:4988975-Amphidinium_carterae.1
MGRALLRARKHLTEASELSSCSPVGRRQPISAHDQSQLSHGVLVHVAPCMVHSNLRVLVGYS